MSTPSPSLQHRSRSVAPYRPRLKWPPLPRFSATKDLRLRDFFMLLASCHLENSSQIRKNELRTQNLNCSSHAKLGKARVATKLRYASCFSQDGWRLVLCLMEERQDYRARRKEYRRQKGAIPYSFRGPFRRIKLLLTRIRPLQIANANRQERRILLLMWKNPAVMKPKHTVRSRIANSSDLLVQYSLRLGFDSSEQ